MHDVGDDGAAGNVNKTVPGCPDGIVFESADMESRIITERREVQFRPRALKEDVVPLPPVPSRKHIDAGGNNYIEVADSTLTCAGFYVGYAGSGFNTGLVARSTFRSSLINVGQGGANGSYMEFRDSDVKTTGAVTLGTGGSAANSTLRFINCTNMTWGGGPSLGNATGLELYLSNSTVTVNGGSVNLGNVNDSKVHVLDGSRMTFVLPSAVFLMMDSARAEIHVEGKNSIMEFTGETNKYLTLQVGVNERPNATNALLRIANGGTFRFRESTFNTVRDLPPRGYVIWVDNGNFYGEVGENGYWWNQLGHLWLRNDAVLRVTGTNSIVNLNCLNILETSKIHLVVGKKGFAQTPVVVGWATLNSSSGLKVDATEWINNTGGELPLIETGTAQKGLLDTLVSHAITSNPELAGVLFAANDGLSIYMKSPKVGGGTTIIVR